MQPAPGRRSIRAKCLRPQLSTQAAQYFVAGEDLVPAPRPAEARWPGLRFRLQQVLPGGLGRRLSFLNELLVMEPEEKHARRIGRGHLA